MNNLVSYCGLEDASSFDIDLPVNENQFRTDQSKRHISWKKISGFVDSGFVKTCDERVIGVKQKGSPIHLLIPPSILKELRQKT